jgi:hypothetical protein
MVAMEPGFLVAGNGERSLHDHPEATPMRCAGCGRVHRDRLVRFFEVRLSDPSTSGGVAADLSLVGPLAHPSAARGTENPEYA